MTASHGTIRDRLRDAARRLAAAGLPDARLDARLLLGEAIGRRVWPHEETRLEADGAARFEAFLKRRLSREPVSRILGRREFWSLDIAVTPDTLVPRPDSESLIEAARDAFAGRPAPRSVLDLGTGTGCLLLAALTVFPAARGIGLDISSEAVATACRNAKDNRLESRAKFSIGNWCDVDCEPVDLVLSNPPYIASEEIGRLAPEVARHDPLQALDGGVDGLRAYRALSRRIPRFLKPDGIAVLELGRNQELPVAALMEAAGLTVRDRRADLSGIPRALVVALR